MYNDSLERIDALYDIVDEIRLSINILSRRNRNYSNYSNNNVQTRGANSNTNRERPNSRYNQNYSRRYENIRRPYSYQPSNLPETTHSGRDNRYSYNNQIYIRGRPYRVEFDRLNTPSSYFNYVPINRPDRSNFNNDVIDILRDFYTTVPVIARPEQIRNATREILFSQINEPLNNSCPITLEAFTSESNVLQIINCGHIFNRQGLTSWFESNVRCPVCRYDIRNSNQTQLHGEQEETKEETRQEETKEENSNTNEGAAAPLPETTNATNNRPLRFHNFNLDNSNNDILGNAFTELTETILGQLFNPQNNNQRASDIILNNRWFDFSNNEITFTGYRI